MSNDAVFNLTVCLIGMLILLVHIANLLIKRGRRKDENALLAFLAFTAFHFAAYFTFTLLKQNYSSDALIMGFYTGFYVANNLEALLLFLYMIYYVEPEERLKKASLILNWVLLGAFLILDFVNLGTRMFFTSESGIYTRASLMFLSQGYQYVMFAAVFLITLLNKKLKVREKIGFALYCFLPLVAIIIQNFFKGYAIAYLSIIVATEVLFFFLNVERNLELEREEKKAKDAQIRVMLSQIKPHFVYNSLSSISTLITIDPEKAQTALDEFTEYLRHNLSSLTEKDLIPFEDELRHIETYVSLEQLRFQDRVKVDYDINESDFYVPPLSVQPVVENAIKHGILKRIEGGTVTVRTYKTADGYACEITDDGVGFDPEILKEDDNKHFGLRNIERRLAIMGQGKMTFDSVLGKGTKVTIIFFDSSWSK